MADFEALCKVLVQTDGNPHWKQVKECGYSFEYFLRMSQPNISRKKLVRNAERYLYERGYRTIGEVRLHGEG